MNVVTYVRPSPKPLASPSDTYSSITDPGRAQPLTVNEPFAMTAPSSTGKFKSALPPVSPSPLSLRVTYGAVPRVASSPADCRSMPICPEAALPEVVMTLPFPANELRDIVQPLAVLTTCTPAP